MLQIFFGNSHCFLCFGCLLRHFQVVEDTCLCFFKDVSNYYSLIKAWILWVYLTFIKRIFLINLFITIITVFNRYILKRISAPLTWAPGLLGLWVSVFIIYFHPVSDLLGSWVDASYDRHQLTVKMLLLLLVVLGSIRQFWCFPGKPIQILRINGNGLNVECHLLTVHEHNLLLLLTVTHLLTVLAPASRSCALALLNINLVLVHKHHPTDALERVAFLLN